MSDESAPERRPGRPPATQTREKIVAAALLLFSERGFDAASVARVAEAAGLSKQALQHHFRNKADLRDAVYERLAQSWVTVFDQMGPALTSLDDSQYGTLIHTAADLFDQQHVVTRFLVRELLDRPDYALGWLMTHARPWFAAVTEASDAARQSGRDDHGIDPEAHLTVVAALLMTTSALLGGGDDVDLGALRERVRAASRKAIVDASHLEVDGRSETS